ncbi:HNH endonuclease [Isoptericola sp. NPDC057653]|uniref:HNH endonuclease n=1 Tax=Isoptericola sp. NPDC057653 TaxID=3346195 RepID=UPI00369237A0
MGRRRTYTEELLADAAANATSYADVLRYLGVPLRSGSYSHIAKRIKEFGIDTSHFTRQRRKYTAEVLSAASAQSDSVAGVLRRLGLTQTGGTHAHISRMLKRLEIDTSHFRRDQGSRRVGSRLSAADVLVRDLSATRRRPPHQLRRALLEVGRAYVCEGCGCDGQWRGAPLTLHVDHISGEFRDNRAENLRFLCPNCHAQTPNFAGRSRGRHGPTRGVVGRAGPDENAA